MSEEFIRQIMLALEQNSMPTGDFLFRLREDFRYIKKTLEDTNLHPDRKENLVRLRILVRDYYSLHSRFDIEDDVE